MRSRFRSAEFEGVIEEHFFSCPYCWQEISMLLELLVDEQSYVEDCERCCNPIAISYSTENGAIARFESTTLQA